MLPARHDDDDKRFGWLFGFYGISTCVGYLTPNSFFMKIVLFQTIQLSIRTDFV